MICFQILQSCLGFINTLMIEDTSLIPNGSASSATPTGAA